MTRIVVTGGAGFIGSHLVDRLVRDGYNVVVIDDLSNGLIENIKGHLTNPRFEFLRKDIRNGTEIGDAVVAADAVIHLAAIVSVVRSFKEPLPVNEVNVTGTLNLLGASVKHKVGRFIYASSAAVYGRSKTLPLRESHPIAPISPYGASKAAGEAYCQAYYETYGLETSILRFMNVYGPRRSTGPYSGVMVKFAEAITRKEPLIVYGDGEQTRDFTYVSDAVDAIVLALERKESSGEAYNIGTGIPSSINQLAKLFVSISGNPNQAIQHVNARKGEVRHSYGDVSKANKMLGYQFKVDLATGLRRFLRWYRETV